MKICVFAALAGCSSGVEILNADAHRSAIINGQVDSGHPAVGFLVTKRPEGVGICTGTLIGTKTVLTAAHCLDGISSASFEVGGREVPATEAVIHSQYSSSVVNAYDVGLVFLDSPVSGIKPPALVQSPPQPGQIITVVGFGVTDTDLSDFGTKRVTQNVIASVAGQYFRYDGSSNGVGNTCQGDSGGPSFREINGEEVLVGVHATASVPCGYAGNDMRVDVFYQWIESQVGTDLGGDTEAPLVAITDPREGEVLDSGFTVRISASDAQSGLGVIRLLVDGELHETGSSSPASFTLDGLQPGQHTLRAEAQDQVGNTGFAQVTVNVQPPSSSPPSSTSSPDDAPDDSPAPGPSPAPGAFGSSCDGPDDCDSALCASDSFTGTSYCTQTCGPQSPCPVESDCVPAGGPMVCAVREQGAALGPDEVLLGSCSMSRGVAGGSWPLGLLLVAMALLGWRRRLTPGARGARSDAQRPC